MSHEDLRREDDRLIGTLVQKVDQLIIDVADVKSSIRWQNGRVRRLENWRWVVLGGMAGVSGIVAIFWKWLEFMLTQSAQVKAMFP